MPPCGGHSSYHGGHSLWAVLGFLWWPDQRTSPESCAFPVALVVSVSCSVHVAYDCVLHGITAVPATGLSLGRWFGRAHLRAPSCTAASWQRHPAWGQTLAAGAPREAKQRVCRITALGLCSGCARAVPCWLPGLNSAVPAGMCCAMPSSLPRLSDLIHAVSSRATQYSLLRLSSAIPAALCHAMRCYAVPSRLASPCRAVPCRAMLCRLLMFNCSGLAVPYLQGCAMPAAQSQRCCACQGVTTWVRVGVSWVQLG